MTNEHGETYGFDDAMKEIASLRAAVALCVDALQSVKNTDDHADAEVRREVRDALAKAREVMGEKK